MWRCRPQPGTEPMSPALRDGFSTTGQTRKSFVFQFQAPRCSFWGSSICFRPHPQPHPSIWLRPSQLPQESFFLPGPWGTTPPWAQLNNSARGFPPPTQQSPFVKYTLVYICNHQANCLCLLLKAVGDNSSTGGCRDCAEDSGFEISSKAYLGLVISSSYALRALLSKSQPD